MQLKTEVYVPTKGLNRDLGNIVFSKDFLYNLINGRLSHNKKSDLFTITNFKGNEFVTEKPGSVLGYSIIDKYLTLFATEKTTEGQTGNLDVIYRFEYINGNIGDDGAELYRGDFGFSPNRAIETLGNYESDDVIKVYFTDPPNPLRVINIVQGVYITDSDYLNGYVSQFNFVPVLELKESYSINKYFNGGSFHSGTIQYVFTYIRKNGAESNIFLSTGINFISEKDRAGSLEETVTCSFGISLSNLESAHFDYVRCYAIERHDLNGTPVVRQLVDYPLTEGTNTVITDTGAGANVDLNYLLTVGGEPLTAGTLESKDNHLFVGDLNILRPTLEDLKDIPIIGFSEFIPSDQMAITETLKTPKVYSGTEANSEVVYAYSPDSLHKDSIKGEFRGFKTGEVYRFAIQAQHESGIWSEALYLEDRECLINIEEKVQAFVGGPVTYHNIVYRMSVTSAFKKGLQSKGYKKVRILYVPLENSDRKIITQGVINSTLFNRKDYENNSFGLYSDYLTRVQPIIDNEFKFLKENSRYLMYGFHQEVRNGYTNPFSFNFRFPQKYHGTILQNTSTSFELGLGMNILKAPDGLMEQGTEFEVFTSDFPATLFEMYEDNLKNTNPMAVNKAYCNMFSPELYYDYYSGKGFESTDKVKCDVVGIIELSYANTGLDTVAGTTHIKKSATQGMDKWAARYGGYTVANVENSFLNTNFPDSSYKFDYFNVYSSTFNDVVTGTTSMEFLFAGKLWGSKGSTLYKHQYRNLYFGRTYYFRSVRQAPSTSVGRTYRMTYDINENYIVNDSSNNITIESHSYSNEVKKLMANLVKDDSEGSDNSLSGMEIRSNLLHYKINNHLLFSLSDVSFIDFTPVRSDETLMPDVTKRVDEYEAQVYDTPSLKRKRAFPITLHEVNYSGEAPQSIYDLAPSYRGWLRKNPVSSLIKPDYLVTNMFVDLREANENIANSIDTGRQRMDNLYIADITRNVQNQYGGQNKSRLTNGDYVYEATKDSLVGNMFIPCGDAYPLDTPYVYATDGDTYIQRFDFNKTQPFDPEYWQQFYESLSYIGTSYMNLDGRYDKWRTTKNFIAKHKGNYGLINKAYSQLNNFFTYRILDYERLNEDNKPSSIAFSLQKFNQEFVDKWLNINLASTQDLDGRAGRLRKIFNFNGKLLAFQDSAISEIIFNPRVQINTSDNIPIEITNSGKFQAFAVLNNKSGCVNKWSIKQIGGRLFYIDNLNKDIMAISSEGFENITSSFGFKTWGDTFLGNTEVFNPRIHNNFIVNADNINGDVYFNWKPLLLEGNILTEYEVSPYEDINLWGKTDCFSGSLLFNNDMSYFETELPYKNVSFMFNIDVDFFSVLNNISEGSFKIYRQNTGPSNIHFGAYYPTYIDYMMGPDYPGDKVFNSISYKHEIYDADQNGLFVPNKTFEDLYVRNNFQKGKKVLMENNQLTSYTKKKFNTWGVTFPREFGTMNRIRSQWIRLRLKYNQPDVNFDMQLHDLELNYTI